MRPGIVGVGCVGVASPVDEAGMAGGLVVVVRGKCHIVGADNLIGKARPGMEIIIGIVVISDRCT